MNHLFAGIPVTDLDAGLAWWSSSWAARVHAAERRRGLLAADRQQLDLRRPGHGARWERADHRVR